MTDDTSRSLARQWRLLLLFVATLATAVFVAQVKAASVNHHPQASLGAKSPAAGPKARLHAGKRPQAGSVTIDARDFASGQPLDHFNYIVNIDNSKLPADSLPSNTESNSPIIREGNEVRNSVDLPQGRYLISVRAPDHKLWGKHISVGGNDPPRTVRVDLTEVSGAHPLPLGKIRVFVFNDNAWTNGAPDTEEAGLGGFQIGLEEQTGSAVTVDYHNQPLCGGVCLTSSNPATLGFVEVNDLGPATYFIDVHPPDRPCNNDPNSRWYQTTTIDGGLSLQAGVEEGSDGTGAPGEQLWEAPNFRTAYWFGFVCAPRPFTSGGTGTITGAARNWLGWPPFDVLTMGEPVENPLVAISDAATDQLIYVDRGDGAGNIDIQNVPAGSYNVAVWDEQLSYIIRFKAITVAPGENVDLNETDVFGETGFGVSRWFGWLDGDVYKDLNGNGVRDTGEPGIANTDMDQRWRDGSIKEGTFTDPTGHYEYPTAEGGALGKWIINEQGFGRFGVTGASVHDEITGDVTHIDGNQGGDLLSNQLLVEGHRSTVDWGKVDYPAGTPGQIVGITYFSTTRNEFDARFQAHEDYEPAVPDMTVLLETLGQDGVPNTSDDVVVNKYVTDHWQQPNDSQTPPQACAVTNAMGLDISADMNPFVGPNCLETPITGEESKDGAFDGGYAFADYCPGGYDLGADDGTCIGGTDPVALVAGTYVTHAVMPNDLTDGRSCNPGGDSNDNDPQFKNISGPFGQEAGAQQGCLYRPVKEEDVNVDLGNEFQPDLPGPPKIPPPDCIGDDHLIDQTTLVRRSNYYGQPGAHAPLCDKRLIVLQNGQNANADFNLMTNFNTDPNGSDPDDTRAGDVEEPGRIVGLVSNDIYFERNQQSMWYGEPRPIGGIPIGIYARVDTVPNAATGHEGGEGPLVTYDENNWRLFTTVYTSPEGTYEALLPSTETFNCPIPQGPCPGMYLVKVNDAGTVAHPNAGYDPQLLTATSAWDVWPGMTDQLDTPLDPISGTACEAPAGAGPGEPDPSDPARPELLQVSRPFVQAADAGNARRVTIQADFIGATGGATGANGVRATLTDARNSQAELLTRANGGIVSWVPGSGSTPDTIIIRVPALASNLAANASPNTTFRPGPKQLTITTANVNGGVSSVNGLTVHVFGTNGTGTNTITYNPPLVTVAAPSVPHAIQNAIDAAAAGSLLVLSPGVYNENVLMWKPVKLQGLGPGGLIGAHELNGRDPEDARFTIPGTVIDGRFFPQEATAFDATVAAHAPYALAAPPLNVVLRGADVTVVAKSTAAYDASGATGIFNAARIDGLALMTGRGDGAGGVQLQANANNVQLTNDVLENNGGIFTGGIGIGQPFARNSHNFNVRIANDRLLGNGGLTTSGGVGVFYGSNNYELSNSVICANFSVEYGAGVSHIGLSPNGAIHDNRIYYNESVDSGAGIAIEGEVAPAGQLSDGSGAVNVDRNLIQSNYSGDDGGGIFVLDALDQPINVRNNMIVDNGASHLGGAIALDDTSKASLINNTVSANVTTGSSEESVVGEPHAAGLVAEANESLWNSDPRYTAQYPNPSTRPDFSNPIALFNNIFWNNNAFTLDQFTPGAALVNQGFIDFEVFGTTRNADTFTPRYSDLTNGQILGPDGVQRPLPGGQGNGSADPSFVTPFTLELTVSASRLDPQVAAVTITGADPPVGLTGDYHLNPGSAAIDRGAGFSNLVVPAPANQTPNANSILAPCSGTTAQSFPGDYDREFRPQTRTTRVRTPWDIGADELSGTNRTIPFSSPTLTFNWNNAGHPQCSGSTETR